MATTTANTAPDNSTDANFRAWGSAISSALNTIGLVQTGDTGQINWTTVTHPTVGSTAQGYEIWRLNDALQATSPFFFKIEYGSGSVPNAPGLWITTGLGSNGSGTITSPSSRFQLDASTNNAGTFTCFFAGDNAGFAMILWPSVTSASIPIFVSMDRSKTVTGADSGTYLAVNCHSPTGTSVPLSYIHLSTGSFIQETTNVPGPLTKLTTTQASGNIALIPVMPCFGFFQYPLRRVIVGINSDWTVGDTPSISLYPGLTDNYVVFKWNNTSTTFGPGSFSNYCVLMRNQ